MKKIFLYTLTAIMLSACGNMDDFPEVLPLTQQEEEPQPVNPIIDDMGSVDNNLTGDLSTKDIATFAIAVDETPYHAIPEVIPSLLADPLYEDYVENMYDSDDEQYTVNIDYAENSVKINGVTYPTGTYYKLIQKKDTFYINGAHVTIHANKKYQYVLTGRSSNGSLKLYQNKKCSITLNGVSLKNPTGAAINMQSGKRSYIIVNGTDNVLGDCPVASYTTKTDPDEGFVEDEKGVIFSEGKISFSGSGRLTVNAVGKNGIASDDYVFLRPGPQITINGAPDADGIKTKDGMYLFGAVVNIVVSGDGAKGLNCENVIDMRNGRITVINNSKATLEGTEFSQSAGIKTDTELRITGGELYVSATQDGGKGIRAKQAYYQGGGTVRITTTGNAMLASNAADANATGLHVGTAKDGMGLLTMNGGRLLTRCDIAVGIESELQTVFNGGVIESLCENKAFVVKDMTMTGGYGYACSGNANGFVAEGDVNITGGLLFACGNVLGIDADQNNIKVDGGTVAAIGTQMPGIASASIAGTATGSIKVMKGSLISFCTPADECIVAMQMPRDYIMTPASMFIATSALSKGAPYTVNHGGSLTLSEKGIALQGFFANGVLISGQTAFKLKI